MRRLGILIILSLFAVQCAGSQKAAQERDAERAKEQVRQALERMKEGTQE